MAVMGRSFFFGGSFEELSDPTNVFTIFGLNSDIPRDPREMGHGHHSHYQQMQYDPWTMDRRGGYWEKDPQVVVARKWQVDSVGWTMDIFHG